VLLSEIKLDKINSNYTLKHNHKHPAKDWLFVMIYLLFVPQCSEYHYSNSLIFFISYELDNWYSEG